MTETPGMEKLRELLLESGCSLVLWNNGNATEFHGRGVSDLYRLLNTSPALLAGAAVADKVVGKGAAALMGAGGVAAVYAHTISRPALEMLAQAHIPVTYGKVVPNIINRRGDDICPVEKLCARCATPAECLPLISEFIDKQQNK